MTTVNLFRDRLTIHPVELGAPPVGVFVLDLVRTKPQTIDAALHKGAVEYEQPSTTTNAPGLDAEGLPNDDMAIAQDAVGARADGTQG
jgi:hypothetical protein